MEILHLQSKKAFIEVHVRISTHAFYNCVTYFKIKIKLRSFKSSERINEKGDGPYHGFGYLSLFSDPIDLATWSQRL